MSETAQPWAIAAERMRDAGYTEAEIKAAREVAEAFLAFREELARLSPGFVSREPSKCAVKDCERPATCEHVVDSGQAIGAVPICEVHCALMGGHLQPTGADK